MHAVDTNNQTALFYAFVKGHFDVMKVLIQNGAVEARAAAMNNLKKSRKDESRKK